MEPGPWPEPEGGRLLGAGDEDRGRPVGDLRRIAGGDPAVLGEGRLELGQRLHRRAGTDALVGGHQLGAAVDIDRHRDDLVLEPALGGGGLGPALALGSVAVEVLPREAVLVGDHVGPDALGRQAGLGVAGLHGGGERRAHPPLDDRGPHRGPGHDLDPGGDHHVVGAGHHPLRREVEGLLAGSALAIDRGGRHGLGPAGGQHRVAPDVERLLADLHDAAHDDVVDDGRVEVVALLEGSQHVGRQIGGVPPLQLPVPLAARGPDRVDDHRFGHLRTLPAAPTGGWTGPIWFCGAITHRFGGWGSQFRGGLDGRSWGRGGQLPVILQLGQSSVGVPPPAGTRATTVTRPPGCRSGSWRS